MQIPVHICVSSADQPQGLFALAKVQAMCFHLRLLLGIIGVLTTRGKESDNSQQLLSVRMELQSAYDEISALKLEVVRLKEELIACVEGHSC